jgi:hypothetical protein
VGDRAASKTARYDEAELLDAALPDSNSSPASQFVGDFIYQDIPSELTELYGHQIGYDNRMAEMSHGDELAIILTDQSALVEVNWSDLENFDRQNGAEVSTDLFSDPDDFFS